MGGALGEGGCGQRARGGLFQGELGTRQWHVLVMWWWGAVLLLFGGCVLWLWTVKLLDCDMLVVLCL